MPYKDKEKYNAYKRKTVKFYAVSVSRVSEQDIIEFLESKRPVNNYIRGLIKQDMQKQN